MLRMALVDYGCVWDGPNYSCAYNSAFTVILSAYCHTDSSWRWLWRDCLDFNEMLSCCFGNILTAMRMPLLRRQLPSLFDACRGRVCDHLNTIDPISFPRFTERLALQLWVLSYFHEMQADLPLCRLCHTPHHCQSLRSCGFGLTSPPRAIGSSQCQPR